MAEGVFWLLKASVVNSYIVYKDRLRQLGQEPMIHLQFRHSLVVSLVSHRLQIPPQSRPGRRADMFGEASFYTSFR